jgi:hypothetical protein
VGGARQRGSLLEPLADPGVPVRLGGFGVPDLEHPERLVGRGGAVLGAQDERHLARAGDEGQPDLVEPAVEGGRRRQVDLLVERQMPRDAPQFGFLERDVPDLETELRDGRQHPLLGLQRLHRDGVDVPGIRLPGDIHLGAQPDGEAGQLPSEDGGERQLVRQWDGERQVPLPCGLQREAAGQRAAVDLRTRRLAVPVAHARHQRQRDVPYLKGAVAAAHVDLARHDAARLAVRLREDRVDGRPACHLPVGHRPFPSRDARGVPPRMSDGFHHAIGSLVPPVRAAGP